MLDSDIKAAIQALADDWRDTQQAGGDCIDYATELVCILSPLIDRFAVSRDEATLLLIHAGNYASGAKPALFTNMLAAL